MKEARCLELCDVGFKRNRKLEICGDKRSFTDGWRELHAPSDKRFNLSGSWVYGIISQGSGFMSLGAS